MDVNPEFCIERAIEASNKKYKCLQDLILLTMAQTEAITEEGMDGLGKLIDEKQAKIDEIINIDEDFEMHFNLLKQKLGVSKLDEIAASRLKGAKELRQVTEKIMELLAEINKLEKQNHEKAKSLLDEFGAKLRQIREGKKLNDLYYNPGAGLTPPSYFVDKKK